MRGTIFASNASWGTNADLPHETAFREHPETPAPTGKQNRDRRIKIRFTPDELAEIKHKAAAAGMDMSKYIRSTLNAAEVLATPKPNFEAFTKQLVHVGRKVDGLLVRARTSGFISAPDLRAALHETGAILRELYAHYEKEEDLHGEAAM